MSLRLLRLSMMVALFTHSDRLTAEWEQEVMAFLFRNWQDRASLVVLQSTVHPPMQGTQVPSLVQEDPTSSGQLSLCITTPKPVNPRAHSPQQEKPPPREAQAAQLESRPHSPRPEKACVQPRRASTAKKRNQLDGFGTRVVKQKDLSLPLPMKTPDSQLTAKQ